MRKAVYPIIDDEYDDQEMAQIIDSDDWFCYFLVDDCEKIIGLVELSARNIVDGCLSNPVAYLEGLYLEAEYRNQGLGKQTIKLILEWCKERGFKELATDTELKNTRAQHFYRMCGFEETDRVVEYCINVE